MSHPHSQGDLSRIDLPENRQLSNHCIYDQTIYHLPREVARYPRGQDAPHIAIDDRLQEPLQCSSPMTRILPEILAYTFELYMASLEEPTLDGVLVHGLFCLAQVCTLWRAIVESEPRLWTSMHFNFPESHQSRAEDVTRVKLLFDLHLKRSRALPLSLTFTDHRMYHFDSQDLISLLVDRLRKHARRWKRISLQLAGAYFRLLFNFTPCDLYSLEHLCISANTVLQGHNVVTGLRLNLESATNLKSFTYNGPGLAGQDIRLHWESLSEISLEFAPHCGESYTLFLQFRNLAQCRNVTTCSLGIDRSGGFNGSPPFTLPCLKTLRVRRLSTSAHARSVIDILTLPQLQTLEIDASIIVGWNEHWHDHNFSSLLTRSRCTLLHLSIQDVDFPDAELMRCLALSPTLTSLGFIPCPRSQDITNLIRELDVSQSVMNGQSGIQAYAQGHVANVCPLVPLLHEITLGSSVTGYLDSMLAMFRSRVGARTPVRVATLRRITVVFFDLWHNTDSVRVCSMADRLQGLTTFQADLAQCVSENKNKNKDEKGYEDSLEALVVVDSPYFPKYIDNR